jgi:acetyl esterase/lipase
LSIRWWRIVLWTAGAFALLVLFATLSLWRKLRGVPVASVKAIDPGRVSVNSDAPQAIRLYPGVAPGSGGWTQKESVVDIGGQLIARNVVEPTLTAYFPPAGNGNGTAMIVCPGGAYQALSMYNEGIAVARNLNSLGIAAFLLKYRLHATEDGFLAAVMRRFRAPGAIQLIRDRMTPLILSDGQQAIRIVRFHAAKWGINPDRIGMIGFSAGGYLALNVALHHDAESMPDFIAGIYPVAPRPLAPPPARIPLFILAAADDPLVSPTENAVRIDETWRSAGVPSELHVMTTGGHGFGMRKEKQPTDAWPDLLCKWLGEQGYLEKAKQAETPKNVE